MTTNTTIAFIFSRTFHLTLQGDHDHDDQDHNHHDKPQPPLPARWAPWPPSRWPPSLPPPPPPTPPPRQARPTLHLRVTGAPAWTTRLPPAGTDSTSGWTEMRKLWDWNGKHFEEWEEKWKILRGKIYLELSLCVPAQCSSGPTAVKFWLMIYFNNKLCKTQTVWAPPR